MVCYRFSGFYEKWSVLSPFATQALLHEQFVDVMYAVAVVPPKFEIPQYKDNEEQFDQLNKHIK